MNLAWTPLAVIVSFIIHLNPPKPMKIMAGQPVPSFVTKDVYGKEISSKSLLGRKTLVAFMRNAGCPVCNFQVHELLQQSDSLQKKGIDVVLIYQSSPETLITYLEQDKYPFTFIPDPGNDLYQLFSVKRSMGKVFKGMFNEAIGKMTKGKNYSNLILPKMVLWI